MPFWLHLQWAAVLLVYLINESQYVPLGWAAQSAIILFLGTFAAVYHLCPALKVPQLSRQRITPWLMYGLATIAGAVSLLALLRLFASGELDSAMGLRDLINEDDSSARVEFGIGYSFPLLMAAWLLSRARRSLAAIPFGIAAGIIALASTSKVFLLLYLIYLVPISVRIDRIPVRLVGRILFLGLAAFAALHIALGKLVSAGGEDIFKALALTLGTYLLSGIAGFALFVRDATDFPQNALWKPLGDLLPGIIRVPDSSILPWASIGAWYGNVYTALAYWLDGLGIYGTVAYVSLLAIFARLLFSQKGIAATYLQRLYFFALLLAFHQDFFVASLKIWIGFLTCALLLSVTNSEQRRRSGPRQQVDAGTATHHVANTSTP